jgi:hypothetical protein
VGQSDLPTLPFLIGHGIGTVVTAMLLFVALLRCLR